MCPDERGVASDHGAKLGRRLSEMPRQIMADAEVHVRQHGHWIQCESTLRERKAFRAAADSEEECGEPTMCRLVARIQRDSPMERSDRSLPIPFPIDLHEAEGRVCFGGSGVELNGAPGCGRCTRIHLRWR